MDLEADPPIDRDNPPDLKSVADAAVAYKDEEEGAPAPGSSGAAAAAAAPAKPAAAQPAGGKKAAAKAQQQPKAAAAAAKPRGDDVYAITDNVIQKVGDWLASTKIWEGPGFGYDVYR